VAGPESQYLLRNRACFFWLKHGTENVWSGYDRQMSGVVLQCLTLICISSTGCKTYPQKSPHSFAGGSGWDLQVIDFMEARVGIEPTHKGFADLSLTAWVPRPESAQIIACNVPSIGCSWSGRPGSNRRHLPWQGSTLPLSYSRSASVTITVLGPLVNVTWTLILLWNRCAEGDASARN
jgi:hypothetical protein